MCVSISPVTVAEASTIPHADAHRNRASHPAPQACTRAARASARYSSWQVYDASLAAGMRAKEMLNPSVMGELCRTAVQKCYGAAANAKSAADALENAGALVDAGLR